jgi:hypothetical protein
VIVPIGIAVAAVSHRVRIFPTIRWILGSIHRQDGRVVQHEIVTVGEAAFRSEAQEEASCEANHHDLGFCETFEVLLCRMLESSKVTLQHHFSDIDSTYLVLP